jgi:hypothetical protein
VLKWLALAVLLLRPAVADATSTINPNLPASGQPYESSVIRGQFDAAANDIQGLQTLNAGTSQPFACTLAVIGTLWLNNTSSPYVLNVCDGTGSWVAELYLDTTNHVVTPPMGRGACQSIVAATTTNLGSVPQSCITVTGNSSVSITSLGSSASVGDVKFVVFQGTNTLVYNATSLILPSATNATTLAGDIWTFEYIGSGNWQAIGHASGAISFSQVTGVATNAQLPTTAAPGTSTNVAASLSAAGATVTFTADSIVTATTLTGTIYPLGNYQKIFNSGITGAGGMDTGALPSSGFVCIYAIYNPTTSGVSILGSNCSTSDSTIYSGANLPSGYTASALIGVWKTNGTPAMTIGYVLGRSFYQVPVSAISITASQSLSEATISTVVPPNAKSYSGYVQIECGSSPGAAQISGEIATDSSGSGEFIQQIYCASTNSLAGATPYSNMGIPVSQQTYIGGSLVGSSPSFTVYVSSYSW